MKIKNLLLQFLAILGAIIFMASCEEEIGTIGSEVIGDQNVNTTLDDTKTIVAYSRKMLPVQSNQLPIYQLGVYNDPTYGTSKVNLLAQLILGETNPDFSEGTVLDSVVLYMPFFSEGTVDTSGDISYTLDSIYGGATPINISIFESEYFLRDFDPSTGFEESQNYYTNQGPLFSSFKGELIHTIEGFIPSANGYTTLEITDDDVSGSDTITNQLGPGIRVMLPNEYFLEKIIEQEGSANLINNNNFRDYLRGFYFEVEGQGDNLIKYDMSNAKIDLHFTAQTLPGVLSVAGDVVVEQRFQGLLTLNFGAISVNVFENELTPQISQDLFEVNTTEGQETLYVRGGSGIISVIELFGDDNDGNGIADELDQMRQEKWLINEANLIFYVDKNRVEAGSKEPERLIIYDLKNNSALIDYAFDTTSGDEPIDSYNIHLGRLERGSDNAGDFYKIRITNHLSNLIHQDSTNVALGLVVSQNVGEPGFQDLENEQAPGIEQIPANSVIAHEGTVLHGNTSTNQARRLKLQIYYTESN
ncbi:DUF4270 domain-containing protein [Patiriisocius sp. Uisw_017]|jgi:hypothetical protein|uniref:DUF4270 domain-containing protein n=1 Tax=Patiriisocius sp. Uisw_017 TaxID=3230968 RepID=UPI0039E8B4CE